MKTLLLIISFLFLISAQAEETKDKLNTWDFQNNPFRIDEQFESHLNKLPLVGNIQDTKIGWPGFHWSLNQGMIANRWQIKDSNNFKYDTYSLNELKSLTQEKLNKLSPAEKFDIFMGDFEYPTVKLARKMSSRTAKEWTGICHGVSPAGIHHKEPNTKTVRTANGLELTFYSSDLKALLAFYYAKISDEGITQIGKRCFAGRFNPIRGGACSDVNPGSFHIIMTNKLGISQTSFIADVDRLKMVWNHVAMKFNSKIISKSGNKAHVKTIISYTGIVEPSKEPILGTNKMKTLDKTYEYELHLDKNDKIIGGEWLSKDHPDFLWINEKEQFTHKYYGKVLDLTL